MIMLRKEARRGVEFDDTASLGNAADVDLLSDKPGIDKISWKRSVFQGKAGDFCSTIHKSFEGYKIWNQVKRTNRRASVK
jgi:hypothetical protein